MTRARVLSFACALIAVMTGASIAFGACELTPADYGRACDDKHPCSSGYQCFQESCVPNDDPLLANDAGPDAPSDAGVVDAG